LSQRRAVSKGGEHGVKFRVQFGIDIERRVIEVGAEQARVHFFGKVAHKRDVGRIDPALGDETRREPLKAAANFDRVGNCAFGEALDFVTTFFALANETFFGEPLQRRARRRARHAGQLDGAHFRQAFVRLDTAFQDQLAQREQGFLRLRIIVLAHAPAYACPVRQPAA
jgi:hypothetical protein